ncbi:MAG: co-chaperone DjlA [Pseudomonadales bacterium]|nr:co-chaperone DjlA [Pseudomonadales bacterium]
MIFGKILGTLFGFSWFGFLGALIGLYVGHLFDKGLAQNFSGAGFSSQAEIQKAFFRMTFLMMGRMAKADGRVSQTEIKWAEYVMGRMNLSSEMRRQAIELFNLGKDDNINIADELKTFRRTVGRHATLIQMFLEIQIQAGYADGELNQQELELLQLARNILGISLFRFEAIHQRIRAERAFASGDYQQYGGAQRQYSAQDKLVEAYRVLGVEPGSSNADVKKAYRRLMSQHHPDKLVAKGLPEEMMRLAKEKTQEISAAYEVIKEARG